LNEVLAELASQNQKQSTVVRRRWFNEFSVREIADLLEVSISTVEQDGRTARAFLFQRLAADQGLRTFGGGWQEVRRRDQRCQPSALARAKRYKKKEAFPDQRSKLDL
jgi:hypothetical protein